VAVGLSVKSLLALARIVILDFRSRRDFSPRFFSLDMYVFRNWASSSTRGGVGLSVEALNLLHRSFSTSISALSQRAGPYGHCAPFVGRSVKLLKVLAGTVMLGF
jgi:hypothetical protein